MTVGHTFRNVAELALGKFAATKHPNFNKIFDVKVFNPECRASPEVAQKYGIAMNNVQQVVAIQNLVTSDLTWWNPARKIKPQNFKTATATTIVDPTGGGATCDFCSWKELTAEDTFGRVEGTYAVTASNLFKYGAPYQGVVMFKHHDPLSFNLLQLCDLLTVADGWFQKAVLEAQKENIPSNTTTSTSTPSEKDQLYPLLVWNCLGRSGASQYHGHSQVMVSGAPFPAIKRESDAAMQYKMQHSEIESDACYYRDLVEAHAVAGLARRLVLPLPFYASSSSSGADIIWDDKVLLEPSLLNSSSTATAHCFVNLCPTKDAEIVIHGASLTCPAFQMLVYAALRALIDDLGVESFNAGINNIPIATTNTRIIENRNSAPVVARVVSRGKASGGASDFGGLEVFAGASIGHTDPWIVLQALDTRLQQTIHE